MNLAVNRCCRSRPQCANKKRKGPDENADAHKNACIDGHEEVGKGLMIGNSNFLGHNPRWWEQRERLTAVSNKHLILRHGNRIPATLA